jgi:multiple sugar transport system permease protein
MISMDAPQAPSTHVPVVNDVVISRDEADSTGLFQPPPNREAAGSRIGHLSANAILIAFGVLFLLPMVWLLLGSIDANASWNIGIPSPTLAHFKAAVSADNLRALLNSIVLSVVSTFVATVVGSLAAYALSRRNIPWKGPLLLFILFLSGVPLAILIIPIYEMFARLGWLSTFPCALFLAVTSLPFEIYLIKNFIDAVPHDLEEAARMERANTMQILLRVIGPLALPGIGAAAIFGFVNAWGSFLVPLVLITSPQEQPGSVAIFGFIGSANVRYGDIAAYSLLYAVPVFILYAFSSRLFRGGFVLGGAVKG